WERARPSLDAQKTAELPHTTDAGIDQHQAAPGLVSQHGAAAFRRHEAPERWSSNQIPIHGSRSCDARAALKIKSADGASTEVHTVAPAPRRMIAITSATTARISST